MATDQNTTIVDYELGDIAIRPDLDLGAVHLVIVDPSGRGVAFLIGPKEASDLALRVAGAVDCLREGEL
jgi:hypothetical protein